VTTPSPDEHPTQVQQATAQQPSVTTAPATRRARIMQRRLPARIGPARTSTVIIGCLFVLLFALNSALPKADNGTVPVTYNGRTVNIPLSALPSDARPTTTAPATPTTQAPAPASSPQPGTAPATTTSGAPRTTTSAPRTPTDQPTTTAPRSTTAPREEQTTPAPTTSRAPTSASRAPVTTDEAPTSAAPAS
jgi:hypothetical protein